MGNLPGQEWTLHPDVHEMVRLAVRRKLRMFDKYPDINARSLYQDIVGQLVKAKYNGKSKPGTFAYRVASCRLIDLSRRRTLEDQKRQTAMQTHGVKSSRVEAAQAPEEIAENLYEAARQIFASAFVPERADTGRPGLSRPQRAALHQLTEQMGWGCREAERSINAEPGIMLAVGIKKAPNYSFFSRAPAFVAKLKDLFLSTSSSR